MSLTLCAHPFSSCCQKVLVALHQNEVPFEYRSLEDPSAMAELKLRWPFARFPVLVDDGHTIVESTHLGGRRCPEPRRLRRSAVALLCRLGPCDCRGASDVTGVPITSARLAGIRPSRR